MIKLTMTTTHFVAKTILTTAVIVSVLTLAPTRASAQPVPTDNPLAKYDLRWTEDIKWSNVVSIADFPGDTHEQRLAGAQAASGKKGGVVYFPPGLCQFKESLHIRDGIVLRGATPGGIIDARDKLYNPPTQFEFPKYVPTFTGDGTPIETAFKGIYLEDQQRASNRGIVNIAINRGHINFGEGPDHKCGGNRMVFGCVLRNAAVADPAIPDSRTAQLPWQRFTRRHHAAITAKARENILIANNRHIGSGGKIINRANAQTRDNAGYDETRE